MYLTLFPFSAIYFYPIAQANNPFLKLSPLINAFRLDGTNN